MKRFPLLPIATVFLFHLVFSGLTLAGDLDDGIEIDEKIELYDCLENPGTNVQYLIRSARARVDQSGSAYTSDDGGDLVVGGFINESGAEVGDVTIIFEGEDINAVNTSK